MQINKKLVKKKEMWAVAQSSNQITLPILVFCSAHDNKSVGSLEHPFKNRLGLC